MSVKAAPPQQATTEESLEASIIVLAYRDGSLLRECLQSIADNVRAPSFEVIVLVNGTQLEWSAALHDVCARVRFILSPVNLGFAAGCNTAARGARGEFLVLLNDDATVQPGWLEALLSTARSHPRAAAVGSRILSPDGRLQEAGSAIFSDGTTCGVGRDLPGDSPEWDFVRVVDYASAASLLIRRSVWEEVGGFNEQYYPAYCEDCDFSMELRERGYQVLFEPRSTIVHRRGQSTQPDFREFLVRRNQALFYQRWRHRLEEYEPMPGRQPTQGSIERAALRARGPLPRLLLVDDQPPVLGASTRLEGTFALVEEASSAGYCVTVACRTPPSSGRDRLRDLGVRLDWGDLAAHLARPEIVYDVVAFCEPRRFTEERATVRALQPAATLLFDYPCLRHLDLLRRAEVEEEAAEADACRQEAAEMRVLEEAIAGEADLCVVHSEEDLSKVGGFPGEAPLRLVAPTEMVGSWTPAPFSARRDLLLVASWDAQSRAHTADAVLWFHHSVLPRVRECVPWVRLIVTGADPPPPVRALRGPNLELVGHVDDLWKLYDRVRGAVSPLRYGCGVAYRTREAIAHGVPVVATRRAVAGLKVTETEVVSVSDDPQLMAQALVDLLRDRQVWEERRSRLAQLHESRPPSAGASWADVLAEARQLRVAALSLGG